MTVIDAINPSPTRAHIRCTHCTLPVPSGLVREDRDDQFCCNACETAHRVINQCGLDRFYDIARSDPRGVARAQSSGRDYSEFNDEAFTGSFVTLDHEHRARATLLLQNVHCAACVWLLERMPSAVPGVLDARLEFTRSRLTLAWDPARVSLAQIAKFIDALGYPCHPPTERAAESARRAESRASLIRLGVAAALCANTMLIAFALYGGMIDGIDETFARFFRYISAALGVLSVGWPGVVFFRGAMSSLRMRTLHMDVPIAIALMLGTLHGLWNTLTNSGEVYFDTLTTLVFLLLLGRHVQARQQRAAAESVERLFAVTPERARKIDQDGSESFVQSDTLVRADLVEVRAGETVPADGIIERGESSLDVAVLTGESQPERVRAGSRVIAGATNLDAPLLIRVEHAGADTRLARLMSLVEEASHRRAPIVRAADRVAGWFAITVLMLAALVAAVWWSIDRAASIEHAVSLLIVTCPCALGLATPLALTVAIGRAAHHGLLIKGGDAVEALGQTGTVVLDKTGTLTHGRFELVEFIGDESLRALIGAAERHSDHVVARTLSSALDDGAEHTVDRFEQRLGKGVTCEVDGVPLLIGSPAWVAASLGLDQLDHQWASAVARAADAGRTPVLAAAHGNIAALAVLGDKPREDTPSVIRRIRAMGWDVRVLSGDDERAVKRVAQDVGIEPAHAIGGASPENKVAFVESCSRDGVVVMVGDGVNDAAALSAATVGVSVHGGADAAALAADVAALTEGIGPVARLLEGSRRSLVVVKRNLAVSLCYNAVFASIAAIGALNPLVAAVIMPLSGITVIALSYRSRTFIGADA